MKHLCGTATKKPVKIEFFYWAGWSQTNVKELFAWFIAMEVQPADVIESVGGGKFRIKTLEGSSYALPNDYYIIRGVEGEFYPCEGTIFEKTYDICTK